MHLKDKVEMGISKDCVFKLTKNFLKIEIKENTEILHTFNLEVEKPKIKILK